MESARSCYERGLITVTMGLEFEGGFGGRFMPATHEEWEKAGKPLSELSFVSAIKSSKQEKSGACRPEKPTGFFRG